MKWPKPKQAQAVFNVLSVIGLITLIVLSLTAYQRINYLESVVNHHDDIILEQRIKASFKEKFEYKGGDIVPDYEVDLEFKTDKCERCQSL